MYVNQTVHQGDTYNVHGRMKFNGTFFGNRWKMSLTGSSLSRFQLWSFAVSSNSNYTCKISSGGPLKRFGGTNIIDLHEEALKFTKFCLGNRHGSIFPVSFRSDAASSAHKTQRITRSSQLQSFCSKSQLHQVPFQSGLFLWSRG